ncbi:MAG: ribosomal protein S18-alanine N-acetyltransferase [Cyanobacteria bacterium P01_D01_bin.128]
MTRSPLTPAHLPSVLVLDRQCFGGLWSEAGYRREMESDRSDFTLLCQADFEPRSPESHRQGTERVIGIGCFWMILEEAHITLIGIAPSYQRQGLGQLLLWDLLSKAHQQGLERATLEVRASNQRALRLYNRFDFKIAGRRRGYYPDGEDALVLWRQALHHPAFVDELQHRQAQICDRLAQQHWQLTETTPGMPT